MAIQDYNELSSLELDTLKEIGSIGTGNSATALSQLIGQTVMCTRAVGGEFLRMAVPKDGMARKFLQDYGFYPVEEAGERVILEKDIRFDPQYLSE